MITAKQARKNAGSHYLANLPIYEIEEILTAIELLSNGGCYYIIRDFPNPIITKYFKRLGYDVYNIDDFSYCVSWKKTCWQKIKEMFGF
jgi:hypothetical protein